MFLQIRHGANSLELNGLRIQTACLPEFHSAVLGEERFLSAEENTEDTFGRGARIRTGGLLRPRQARYQAALRPDSDKFLFYWNLQLLS